MIGRARSAAPRLLLAGWLGLALALAGCGGGASDRSREPSAKRLFVDTCGGCHALRDAGTTGTVGPDLDLMSPAPQQIVGMIERGGRTMPAGLLDDADAAQVAEYVASVAGTDTRATARD